MTVFRRRRPSGKRDATFSYDFEFGASRYRGSTHQITRDAAQQFEARLKDRLRRQQHGLAVDLEPADTPSFQDWAETVYDVQARRVTRPSRVHDLIVSVLRFWGAKPKPEPGIRIDEAAPYHDLRLGDVVRDPHWIEEFERWMVDKKIAPQTRNHYRSMLSVMFKIAAEPSFRKETGIVSNPFAGVHRDKPGGRTVTLSPDELRQWIGAASPHARLAIAIGALVPKLRLQSILGLRWDEHVDLERKVITVWQHKTSARTGTPQVFPITPELDAILAHARKTRPGKWVVTYQGRKLKTIRGATKAALLRVGLTPGRKGGVTFHTLRHSAATLLVRQRGVAQAQQALGHRSISSTMRYTHLTSGDLDETAAALSALYDLVPIMVGEMAGTLDGITRETAGIREVVTSESAGERGDKS